MMSAGYAPTCHGEADVAVEVSGARIFLGIFRSSLYVPFLSQQESWKST